MLNGVGVTGDGLNPLASNGNDDDVLALSGLLDVDGVVGAFVTNPAGDIRYQDVPASIRPSQLRRTAARLARVLSCARLCDFEVEGCTLKLGGQRLRVEEVNGGLLCVLLAASTNQRVLRTALDLVRAELDARDGSLAATEIPERSMPATDIPVSEVPESEPTRRDVSAYDDEETTVRSDFSDAILDGRLQR